ncbi:MULTISPECIES: 3'-5' exonuclease [Sulfurovum]|uniref:3'-5' exonuclease n=1 Tax=Sulfurovum xiamenensis TaxID=3019066 RepID=A0ABT7QNU4_9BACT|nr:MULTISPECIES: 3'-5' exonuclease [Sulfurovum]EIF50801.1 DNA polymerase III subunit epsilon [Sulfurovum sp. AR]MDM5262731.1 3'-5' exonuclease [Sulfurovum xiamenensis]
MFRSLKKKWNLKYLKDERFRFLFDDSEEDEIVVFDCETTGLNPAVDTIVSIGAVKIKGNKILTNEAIHIYVDQDKEIDHKSITIHQIRNCDLHGAIPIEEAIERFLFYVGNRSLAGYYLKFDVAMINKYIKPMYGITLPNKQEEVSAIYYDKKISTIPQGNIDLRFDTILEDLDLPKLQAHDALNDAIMTALIYLKLKHTTKLK